jgi:hypothetical protein
MSSDDQYYTKSFMREEQEEHANDPIVPPQNEYFYEYAHIPNEVNECDSTEIEILILFAAIIIIACICRKIAK